MSMSMTRTALRSPATRYGTAVALVALAFASTWWGPVDAVRSGPFLPFVAAILAASWLAGPGPALLACALSIPTALYSVIEPVGTFSAATSQHATPLVAFGALGVLLLAHSSALRTAATDAERTLATREEFLTLASHELKTPVAAASLHVESLRRCLARRDVEKATTLLEKLGRALTRLTRLVDALLESTSVPPSAPLELHRERVDLSEVMAHVVAELAHEAEAVGSRLELRATSVRGAFDVAALERIGANLVENALRFGAGEPIEIVVERTATGARIAVRDHGIGVPHAERARIFERFGRAVPSRNFGGFGLGLWLARRLVEAHGGTIEVEETPGGGATFVVVLPIVD